MYYTTNELDLSYRITKKEFTKGLRNTINHYRKWLKGECKRNTLEKNDKYGIIEDIDARKEHEIGVCHLGRYYSFDFENKNFRDRPRLIIPKTTKQTMKNNFFYTLKRDKTPSIPTYRGNR